MTVQAQVFVPRPKKVGGGSSAGRKITVSAEINNPDAGKVDEELDPPNDSVDDNYAGINFMGGPLSEGDRGTIVMLSCGDTLDTFVEKLGVAEPAFSLPLHMPNYAHILAICFAGCMNEALSTQGMSIHP